MKTSTKNVIITGIFTVIAGFAGGFAVGYNFQNSEIRDVMKQNGLVNISYRDSSDEIVMKLLEALLYNINKLEEKNEKEKEKMIEAISQIIFSENQIWSEDSLLNSEGMSADWQRIGKKWYYFDSVNRKKKIGWQQIDSSWYYFDLINGSMKTKWQQIDSRWYYFDSRYGDMKTGWQQINNKWYYLDSVNGDMKTGWQQIDNKWYYLDLVSGSMKTGWQQIEGKWYRMAENGECLLNTVTEDGYIVNEKGEWVGSVNKIFEK